MTIFADENTELKNNGFFERTIKWNVDVIANKKHANGYIVQHIKRKTEASEVFWQHCENKENFCHEYWEAWPVKDGKIIYPIENDISYDDRWFYGDNLKGFNRLMYDYKDKFYSWGKITMTGNVYWLESEDERSAVLKTSFRNNAVEYAGELLSASTFDKMNRNEMRGSQSFCSSWDFSSKEKSIEAIYQFYEKRKDISTEKALEDIKRFFSDVDFYEEMKNFLEKKLVRGED